MTVVRQKQRQAQQNSGIDAEAYASRPLAAISMTCALASHGVMVVEYSMAGWHIEDGGDVWKAFLEREDTLGWHVEEMSAPSLEELENKMLARQRSIMLNKAHRERKL